MGVIRWLIGSIINLDVHLKDLIQAYGTWTYGLLFLIIFAETGLVFTPFLPGDSLLFAAGTFAAAGSLNIAALFLLLSGASILGDTVNYWIGHTIGIKICKSGWVKQEYMDRTHTFYEKYGGKTIILARFVPIVRTFAPFVAGVAEMSYTRFLGYNIVGGVAWVALFVFGGYFFGNIPFVQENFTLVIFLIIVLSVIPPIIEYVEHRRTRKENNNHST